MKSAVSFCVDRRLIILGIVFEILYAVFKAYVAGSPRV